MKGRFRAPWARRLAFILLLDVGCGLFLGRQTLGLPAQDADLKLTSSSFRFNAEIPARFSCEGADASPALSWSDPPSGTRSFALVVSDPDAPSGNFIHWVIYDLPASMRFLPEGVAPGPDAGGGHQGKNSFGKTGYNGPCPPQGKAHRYFFRVWALNSTIDLQDPSADDLQSAMQGHILAHGETMGRFRR